MLKYWSNTVLTIAGVDRGSNSVSTLLSNWNRYRLHVHDSLPWPPTATATAKKVTDIELVHGSVAGLAHLEILLTAITAEGAEAMANVDHLMGHADQAEITVGDMTWSMSVHHQQQPGEQLVVPDQEPAIQQAVIYIVSPIPQVACRQLESPLNIGSIRVNLMPTLFIH